MFWIQCFYNASPPWKICEWRQNSERLYITVYSLAGYDGFAIISLHGSVSAHYPSSYNMKTNYSCQQDAARNFSTSAFRANTLTRLISDVFFTPKFNHSYTNDWLRNCTTSIDRMNNINLSWWKRNKVIVIFVLVTLYLFIIFFIWYFGNSICQQKKGKLANL